MPRRHTLGGALLMDGLKSKPVRAPAHNHRRTSRRGVALIMVLVITTILTALAADLSNDTQVNLRASVNARDELQAHFHARSALELEFFVLRLQGQLKQTIGKLLPIPLFELSGMLVSSDTVKGIIDKDGNPEDEIIKPVERSFAKDLPIGDFNGSFWIEEVVDENRKLNLNTTSLGVGKLNMFPVLLAGIFGDPKYNPIFEHMGDSRDPLRNRLDLIAQLMDWVDNNETIEPLASLTGNRVSSGAEDAPYTILPYDANYRPKNGKLDSVQEIRMIPYVTDAFMEVFGKFFTVWADNNGISMRTADPWMIKAVIRSLMSRPVDPNDDERFKEFFNQWTKLTSVPGGQSLISEQSLVVTMEAAGIKHDPQRLKSLTEANAIRFDDISGVYRITAVGRVNNASSKITVVWRDNSGPGEIKYWRED